MSGGTYDYAYLKIEDLADTIRINGICDCASPALRQAFVEHLRKVSLAAKAIEWNDSCDGAANETELIEARLREDAEVCSAVSRLECTNGFADEPEELEVIGNIHENLELIQRQNVKTVDIE